MIRWLVIRFRVGAGWVWMMGGDACVALVPYNDSFLSHLVVGCWAVWWGRLRRPGAFHLRVNKPGRCRFIAHTADYVD